MFKSVLIIIVVIVILMVIRTIMQRFKPAAEGKNMPSHDTLQCEYCKTYIPRNEAYIKMEKAFCNTQHYNSWNKTP